MRKILILLAIVIFLPAAGVFAAPTTPDNAKLAVKNWLGLEKTPLVARLGKEIREVQTFRDDSGDPLYHIVYLHPNGFVIVAGDDLVEPIIGFLSGGKYDRSWKNPLGALVDRDVPLRVSIARQQERYAASQSPDFSPSGHMAKAGKARSKWERLKSAGPLSLQAPLQASSASISDIRVSPLVQSKWDQTTVSGTRISCYNYYTPPGNPGSSGNDPAGCVATAASQIMRYFSYPATPVGTGAYTYYVDFPTSIPMTGNLLGGDGAGGAYDWTNMPLVPDSSIQASQSQAIGSLLWDVGISSHMGYSSTQSGAYLADLQNALINTFHYSNAIYAWKQNQNISGADLVNIINPNLDAFFPVLLGIYTGSSVGHAVVVDGYGYDATFTSTLYHHLNMGWSGYNDAWYDLPDIPAGYDFKIVGDCVYNIYPTGSGEIISGRVTDSAGNPVSDVAITATRNGGGTYAAVTNSNGIYALPNIPSASTYTISASKTGYKFTSQSEQAETSTNFSTSVGNIWGVNFGDNTWSGTGKLSVAHFNHTATLLSDGRVLTAGGWKEVSPDGVIITSELYDTSIGAWTKTADIGVARVGHTATLLPDCKVLVAGGYNWDDLYVASCELYDPSTGAWTSTGNLNAERGGHTATLLPNGKVLVSGGIEWHNGVGTYHSSCELYDPSTGTWTPTGNLLTARYYHTATLLSNGKVLVTGGQNDLGYIASCELYDPSTGAWTETGSLGTGRCFFTATLLQNGKVLVAGGYDDDSRSLSSCELYDPSTGIWASTGDLGDARTWHTASQLQNGNVLVSGGFNIFVYDYLSTCEIYDPTTETWTATNNLGTARGLHTSTLLQNGNVLVTGGHDSYSFFSSCEVYDALDGTTGPLNVPGAPTGVRATAGIAQATVTFNPPASDGGNPITGYNVLSNPAGGTDTNAGSTSTTHIVTGLANGTVYTFTVSATNTAGTGPPSHRSNSVTPCTVPGAPVGVRASAGTAQATVSFTPPVSNGGSPITGYTVASNPAGGTDANAGATSTTHVVTGLTNGTVYTFTVTAANAAGTGPPSDPSNAVTPCTVPGAPTNVTATAGITSATVSFTLPASDGGSPITGYTVISNPAGGVDSNAGTNLTTHIMTGLVNGTAYTFTVTAVNTVGAGPASDPSNTVTPSLVILTSPGGGEIWHAGSTQTITWDYGGNSRHFRIDVLLNGTKVTRIVPNIKAGANGSGSYRWDIPKTKTPAGNYQIRISSTTDSSFADTSNAFTIAAPTIRLASPDGSNWSTRAEYAITWSYEGNPGPVRIALFKGGSKVNTITPSTSKGPDGNGSYLWIIPKTVASGSDYQIVVSSRAIPSCTAVSGYFTISGSAISVSSPASGQTMPAGLECPIAWNYTGNPGPVRIDLFKGSSKLYTITSSTPVRSDSYSWQIPSWQPSGTDYTVKITSLANRLISAASSTFIITGINQLPHFHASLP